MICYATNINNRQLVIINLNQITKSILIGSVACLLHFLPLCAQDTIPSSFNHRVINRFSIEARPDYVLPTNGFLRGQNSKNRPIDFDMSFHFAYSFQYDSRSEKGRIYGNPYQGIGVGTNNYGDYREMGNPVSVYLFQGARIAQFSRRFSLNYEWNFGISTGWEPYNITNNPNNGAVGSKMNAYINAGVYLNTRLSSHVDVITGASFSHFSNGNTHYPNAGINNIGPRVGLVYYFNRHKFDGEETGEELQPLPAFKRRLVYDVLLFGAFRRKGVDYGDKMIAMPGTYPVYGFNFATLYSLCPRLRLGVSLDGVYDESANFRVIPEEIVEVGQDEIYVEYSEAPVSERIALGISLRAQFVMPIFTIDIGVGNNCLYAKGDTRGFYQQLSLKIDVFKGSYLNVGYRLHRFSDPNFLMLGVGYRFQ